MKLHEKVNQLEKEIKRIEVVAKAGSVLQQTSSKIVIGKLRRYSNGSYAIATGENDYHIDTGIACTYIIAGWIEKVWPDTTWDFILRGWDIHKSATDTVEIDIHTYSNGAQNIGIEVGFIYDE